MKFSVTLQHHEIISAVDYLNFKTVMAQNENHTENVMCHETCMKLLEKFSSHLD